MKRNVVSLTIAVLFLTLAVTGVMGFFLPFNILTVSVHALLGFVFIGSIALHLKNNFRQLKNYFTSKTALLVILCVAALVTVILMQPKPVLAILGLSKNLGPAADRFELKDTKMIYNYTPAPHYKMQLDFKGGRAFDAEKPPRVAIWLENTSRYHLKTLYHSKAPDAQQMLPYWHYKKSEYEKYKAESEAAEKAGKKQAEDVDALSSATPNESFDPADYIVPKDPEKETPYRLLIEINALMTAMSITQTSRRWFTWSRSITSAHVAIRCSIWWVTPSQKWTRKRGRSSGHFFMLMEPSPQHMIFLIVLYCSLSALSP